MSRLPELPHEALTPEQQRLYEEITRTLPSGKVRGPWAIWLRTPAVDDAAIRMFRAFRSHGRLEERLFELMVLVIAHRWAAQFAWAAHADRGITVGLSPEVVDAIRAGRRPHFHRDDEGLVYDVLGEILERRSLSQAAYDRAQAALGVESLVELIAGAGFYTMVCMSLRVFDSPAPG